VEYFISVVDYAKQRTDRPYKYTFFNTTHMLVGVNVLAPGQNQAIHDHQHQDKFYFVVEGTGQFTVGDQTVPCTPGTLILAPAGIEHGVQNPGTQRLVFLTTIAPSMA
jgi:mannose-6-phosphate isomerase-like protein (cupin superfamily)